MSTIAVTSRTVTIGVDTHSEVHVAAAVDELGRMLGSASFSATPAGSAELLRWAQQHGSVATFGVEGTGSYGAQLTRDLQTAGERVLEVDRPDRKARRRDPRSGGEVIEGHAADLRWREVLLYPARDRAGLVAPPVLASEAAARDEVVDLSLCDVLLELHEGR